MSRRSRRRTPDAPSARPDYLRTLGEDVDSGLALVVHDLIATNAMGRAEAESAVRIRAAEQVGFLIDNDLGVSAKEIAVWVAEAIQEDLVEGLGSKPGLVVWPRCPDHPNHPLWLRDSPMTPGDGSRSVTDETWTCTTTTRSVAQLGRL